VAVLQRGLIRKAEMKKGIIVALLLSVVFNLTACEVHSFGKSYDVHWAVIAIQAVVVLLLTFIFVGLRVSKTKYVCSHCNGAFYPNFWKSAYSIHMNRQRLFKCPHCGKKGFCKPWRDDI